MSDYIAISGQKYLFFLEASTFSCKKFTSEGFFPAFSPRKYTLLAFWEGVKGILGRFSGHFLGTHTIDV